MNTIFIWQRDCYLNFPKLQQIMQKEKQCATYIFSKVGHPYDNKLPYQKQLIFSQMLLGSLFIRGYRMAVKNQQREFCIFYLRNDFYTEYLYLKFYETSSEVTTKSDFSDIYEAIKMIDTMKQTQQPNYKVIFCYLKECSYTELDKSQFNDFTISEEQILLQKISSNKELQIDHDKMTVTDKAQHTKLKDIVWTYINTFGRKHKNNYYKDLQKRNPTTFNIEKMINTINWIIYCETVNKPYNQIQTATWTCFQRRSQEKLKADRKDILLTGSAKTMMIHLLLLERIENYKKEYKSEVSDVIFQFRKSYLQGEIKAYEINNQLDQFNLIYQLRWQTLDKFP